MNALALLWAHQEDVGQQAPEVRPNSAETLPEEHALGHEGLEGAAADGALGERALEQREDGGHLRATGGWVTILKSIKTYYHQIEEIKTRIKTFQLLRVFISSRNKNP